MKKIKTHATVKPLKSSTIKSSSATGKPYPWTKELALVSATGFLGLVISLTLLAEYKTQLYKIFRLIFGAIFGWDTGN